MNLLAPDKNLMLLKTYHTSAKTMIPLTLGSVLFHGIDTKLAQYLDYANIINLGYHSYVSTSCVITDYIHKIPIKSIEQPVRMLNLKSHGLACIGFCYYVQKCNKY